MRPAAFFLTLTLLLTVFVLPTPLTAAPGASLRPGNHTLTLRVDGRDRSAILHVPPQARAGTPLPLLVVLHGGYGSGRDMQRALGFDRYADARGFLVVYPDAFNGMRWNDGRGTLDSSRAGVDDVAFLVALIDEVAARAPLDRRRVHATGASNGGMMAYRLGCETRGVFAGLAPVIANVPRPIAATCAPQAPINLLSINGDADPFIPFEGGEVCANVRGGCEKGFVLSTAESVGRFAGANGCAARPQVTALPPVVDDGTSVEHHVYPGCAGGAKVELYVVRGGGHAWPPRRPRVAAGGVASGNLDATRVIVDFFFPQG